MSVFTFETEPTRVSSPWLQPTDVSQVKKLEAEPQEGPTEYKLHLLLRPRRAYSAVNRYPEPSNQPSQGAGSQLLNHGESRRELKQAALETSPGPSTETRRDRLYHLTTQLLWRLQQSSPYKAARSSTVVLPQLPDDNTDLRSAAKPGKLSPGLEDSRGALYEIGVSDDGTLVGLTKDEMDDSLLTLRVMAASLGCNIEILRMIIVGDCEWEEATLEATEIGEYAIHTHKENLWVAEAFVKPNMGGTQEFKQVEQPAPHASPLTATKEHDLSAESLTLDQLRITLTGPTTSGKSTLLGTLSTGNLDNGYGKSRSFLLKHRHELVSGVTSSVAQELIGYREDQILNYSNPDIESWIDIHDRAQNGRLVFMSDSAGHTRYRRTILRGLVGWSPHWTLLCIPADDVEATPSVSDRSSPAPDFLDPAGSGVDLTRAHLNLCLSLGLPLIIVITKLDLATKASLQRTLGKILSGIKDAGRTPKILPGQRSLSDPSRVPSDDNAAIKTITNQMLEMQDLTRHVPIVLTSAVKGTGLGLIHALLQNLPLPPSPTAHDYIGMALNPEQPYSLFHVEDKFSLPASYSISVRGDEEPDMGTVVAGYLRFGALAVGDRIVVGPFPAEEDESRALTPDDRPSPGSYSLSLSHPSSTELSRIALRNAVSASSIKGEWHNAHIVSIRNLRFPVRKLEAGQVGSIGLVFDMPSENLADSIFENAPRTMPKIRKGMVLAIPSKHMIDTGLSLQAASGLTATFSDPAVASLTIGSLVNIYAASVRASARILRVRRERVRMGMQQMSAEDVDDDVFNLNDQMEAENSEPVTNDMYEVTLELLTNREWLEMGSQIVILEGSSKDRSGLEGFVGKVVEIVD